MIDMDKPLVITHYDSSVDGKVEGHDFKSFMLMTLGAEGKDAKATLKLAGGGLESSRIKTPGTGFASSGDISRALKDAVRGRLQKTLEDMENRASRTGGTDNIKNKINEVREEFNKAIAASVNEKEGGLNCGKVKAIVRNVRWFEANVTVERLLGMDASDLTQLATSKSARAKADDYLDPDEDEALKRCEDVEKAIDKCSDEMIEEVVGELNGLTECFLSERERGMRRMVEDLEKFVNLAKEDTGNQSYNVGKRKEVLGQLGKLGGMHEIDSSENLSQITSKDKRGAYFTGSFGKKIASISNGIEKANADYETAKAGMEQEIKDLELDIEHSNDVAERKSRTSEKEKIEAKLENLKSKRSKMDLAQTADIADAVKLAKSQIGEYKHRLESTIARRNNYLNEHLGIKPASFSISADGKLQLSEPKQHIRSQFREITRVLMAPLLFKERKDARISEEDKQTVNEQIRNVGIPLDEAKLIMKLIENKLCNVRWKKIKGGLSHMSVDGLLNASSKMFKKAGLDLRTTIGDFDALQVNEGGDRLIRIEGKTEDQVYEQLVDLLDKKVNVAKPKMDKGLEIGLEDLSGFEDSLQDLKEEESKKINAKWDEIKEKMSRAPAEGLLNACSRMLGIVGLDPRATISDFDALKVDEGGDKLIRVEGKNDALVISQLVDLLDKKVMQGDERPEVGLGDLLSFEDYLRAGSEQVQAQA